MPSPAEFALPAGARCSASAVSASSGGFAHVGAVDGARGRPLRCRGALGADGMLSRGRARCATTRGGLTDRGRLVAGSLWSACRSGWSCWVARAGAVDRHRYRGGFVLGRSLLLAGGREVERVPARADPGRRARIEGPEHLGRGRRSAGNCRGRRRRTKRFRATTTACSPAAGGLVSLVLFASAVRSNVPMMVGCPAGVAGRMVGRDRHHRFPDEFPHARTGDARRHGGAVASQRGPGRWATRRRLPYHPTPGVGFRCIASSWSVCIAVSAPRV